MSRPLSRRAASTAAALLLATAVALLAACATSPSGSTAAAPAGQTQGASVVTTLSGQTVSVPNGIPAVLYFFSVGCGECIGGAKSLAQAAHQAQQAGRKADFLLVDMDPTESARTIAGFQRDTDTQQLPAIVDTGAALSRRFHIAALSTLIVVDPTGKVTYRGTDPAIEQITAALAKVGAR